MGNCLGKNDQKGVLQFGEILQPPETIPYITVASPPPSPILNVIGTTYDAQI